VAIEHLKSSAWFEWPDGKGSIAVADDSILLVEVSDRIAVVTLNRPHARNALSSALHDQLRRAVIALDTDDSVDVVILTGADPAFCAGLDLKELESGTPLAALAGDPDAGEPLGPWPVTDKPVIAAVNGPAVTGGLELALNCDFIIASERASFADTHSKVGIHPGWGLTVLLPQAIGLRRAKQLSATGNYIDATTAEAWGLANQVVAHDQLIKHCRGLGADIASNDQTCVRGLRRTYDDAAQITVAAGRQLEAETFAGWQRGKTPTASEIGARRRQIQDRRRHPETH
jgi:enoyl-CoA hydratase